MLRIYILLVAMLNLVGLDRRGALVVTDLRNKLIQLGHHEAVYRRSLADNITPNGLRLKKLAYIGEVSEAFQRKWDNSLSNEERDLISLLSKEVMEKLERERINYESSLNNLKRLKGEVFVREFNEFLNIQDVELKKVLSRRRIRKLGQWRSCRNAEQEARQTRLRRELRSNGQGVVSDEVTPSNGR